MNTQRHSLARRGTGIVLIVALAFAAALAGCQFSGAASPTDAAPLAGGGPVVTAASASGSGPATGPMAEAITIVADGSAQAAPDRAVVHVGVQTTSEDVSAALDENNAALVAIQTALGKLGIEARYIQTTGFNFHPMFGPPQGRVEGPVAPPTEIAAFRLMHSLQIVTDGAAQASDAIKAAIAAGANQGGSVSFTLSDLGTLREEATANALANAQAQAEAIAAQIGVQLGDVIAVTQQGSSQPGPMLMQAGMGGGGGGPPIAPGMASVGVRLQVAYAYTR